jgi:hypothetical protein
MKDQNPNAKEYKIIKPPKMLKACDKPRIIADKKKTINDAIAGTNPCIPLSDFNFLMAV